jgi:hypothetical protein
MTEQEARDDMHTALSAILKAGVSGLSIAHDQRPSFEAYGQTTPLARARGACELRDPEWFLDALHSPLSRAVAQARSREPGYWATAVPVPSKAIWSRREARSSTWLR